MKQKVGLLIVLLCAVQFIMAVPPFIEGAFYPREIAVGFDNAVVQQKGGIINAEQVDGIVKTQIESFDTLAEEFRFVGLEQKYWVKDQEWNDNGLYPMNIYKITLERNDNIEEALAALLQNKHILFAEYETIYRTRYTPNDPMFGMQWGLPQIEAHLAWDYTMGSEEVVVGIVDSGIYWIHEDLQDNIWVNQAELDAGMTINWETGTISGGNGIDDDGNGRVDDVIGWNFYNGNNNSLQSVTDNDHGTHVAGCAGAVGDNEIGVIGAAPGIKLISSKHQGDTPTGGVYNGNAGIIYCADSGAHVINCSWGGPGGGTQSNNIINYATEQGALVVAAAGNDNVEHNDSYQDFPSDADNALSVAATDPNDVKTYFSDYGDPIDISCPGINIRSTVIPDYASYQGTSMASPIVAGVAALVKSVHPDLTPLQLRQRLMDTADYIDDVNPDYAGLLGAGRVNAFTATMYDQVPKLEISNLDVSEYEGDGDGIPNPGEIVDVTMVLQNGIFSAGFFAAAEDVVVTASTNMEGVSILEGTETFNISYIGMAGNGNNFDQPIKVQTLADENVLDIPLTISIEANPDAEYPYQAEYEVIVPLSLYQAGWPFVMEGTSSSSPLIVDIDNDGTHEVIFTDSSNRLHALAADGTSELPGFPITFGAQSGTFSASPAVEDITGDGYLEIVVGNEAGYLFAVDRTGEILFTYDAGGQIRANPIIADINNDGTMQIIAMTFTNPQLIILNADGTYFGNSPYSLSAGVMSSPAVGDFTGDDNLEIVLTAVTGQLHVIDGNDGTDIEGWPYALGIGSWNGPIVADINGDGNPQVLVTLLNGKIVVVNHDGSLEFERSLGNQVRSAVVTGDLNNNDSIEIITLSSSGSLYVMDSNGNDIDGFPIDFAVQVEATPILADMDNNGTIDIIFGDSDGYLHAVDLNGTEAPNFPLFVDNGVKISAALGDVDGDGDHEIVVPNQYSMLVIDYKHQIGQIEWSCFKRDTGRKGNAFYETSSTSGEEIVLTPFITKLGNNYPNPFNPDTKIEFTLQNDSFVTLSIFNVKGQKVKTLVNTQKNSGYHIVDWNGKDDANKSVSSGVYFYRLKTDSYQSIKKMMLLK